MIHHVGHNFAKCSELFEAVAGSVPDVAGVEGDAAPLEMGEAGDGLDEGEEFVAGLDADAAEADVHFGKDADFDLRFAGGVAERAGGGEGVERDGELGLAGHVAKAEELLAADDGVGDEEIGRAGGEHDFGLGGLGDGEADGAEFDLAAAESRDLVGLGMGTEAEAVAAGVIGYGAKVALHDVEVDDDGGRVEVGNAHGYYFFLLGSIKRTLTRGGALR